MIDDIDLEREELEELLGADEGLSHLEVRAWGKALVMYSGEGDEQWKHARLTALSTGDWRLDLLRHTGRWEKTPFTGTMEEIVEIMISMLGWHLSPRP